MLKEARSGTQARPWRACRPPLDAQTANTRFSYCINHLYQSKNRKLFSPNFVVNTNEHHVVAYFKYPGTSSPPSLPPNILPIRQRKRFSHLSGSPLCLRGTWTGSQTWPNVGKVSICTVFLETLTDWTEAGNTGLICSACRQRRKCSVYVVHWCMYY